MTAGRRRERAGPAAAARPAVQRDRDRAARAPCAALLTDKAAWRDVLARTETGQTYDDALWHTLAAEVGCAGLLIPESLGGAGASLPRGRGGGGGARPGGRARCRSWAARSSRRRRCWRPVTPSCSRAGQRRGDRRAGRAVRRRARARRPAPTVRLEARSPATRPATTGSAARSPGVADALPADVLLVPADSVPYGLYAVRVSERWRRQAAAGLAGHDPAAVRHDARRARWRARSPSGPAAEQAVAAALLAGAGVAGLRAVRPGRARAWS